MPRIRPLEPEEAPQEARPLVEQGERAAGKVLNFHKELSNSPRAFKGYMDLSATLQGGELDRKVQESIAVAVSHFNGCHY